jgi:type I restriction enzyme S subunit
MRKRFDLYKDSGVEWIGEIPKHWENKKLGYSVETIVPMRDKPTSLVGEIPWVRIEDFDGKYIYGSKSNQGVSIDLIKQMNLKVYPVNTVITTCSCSFGTTMIVKKPLTSNQTFIGLLPDKIKLNEEFLYYQLIVWEKELERLSSGSIQKYLSRDNFKSLKFLFPPLSEQLQIVEYLDTKTSMIDSLIEKTKRKIELLKEKRTSLINEVVTKGLNPNVEMKDSGVEWIGEIPKHWELRKGSTIGYYSKGNGIKKDEVRETGLPCIRYGEIYTKYNHKFERVETFIDEGITDVKVSSGTLFMTGSGELLEEIGKCVVYVGTEELYVGGDIIILKPFSYFDSEFLSYQINSECIRIQRELNGRGGIIVHIYSKNFKDMWFPIPSLYEQQEIVSYLDEQTQLIDKTISIKERRIKLLKEYRQSLISEVVTGKVKVTTDEHTE